MNDEQDAQTTDKEVETKIKDAKIVRRIVLIVISTIVVLLTIGIFSVYSYVTSALKPVDPDSDEIVVISIPLGSSTSQIANILEENNLIKDSRIFKLYLKFKNEASFQAGDNYELSPAQTMNEIIEELQTGVIIAEAEHVITIPEGLNLEQIAEIYSARFEFTKDEFMEKTTDEDYLNELMEKYSNTLSDKILNKELIRPLEGYLFAGTYDIFEKEPSVESIIDMMIARTSTILNSLISEIEQSPFDIHEVITMASIIEGEAKFNEDRPKVAQVYLNRLNNNMRLQSDITVRYGLPHKAIITYDDLEIDTPYNTYLNDGLPIGPINSPSNESISAVLFPEGEEFDKLYYFSRPNGETFYSNTLEEHNRVIDRYRHEWYDLEDE